jgi:hypothetical protein
MHRSEVVLMLQGVCISGTLVFGAIVILLVTSCGYKGLVVVYGELGLLLALARLGPKGL